MINAKLKIFIITLAAAAIMIGKTAGAEVVDKIAAVVNSDIITEYELGNKLAAKERGKMISKPDANLRQDILEKMIDETLLNQLLSISKIEVSDDDMARAIANVLHQNRMTIDELKGEIAAKGMNYDEYKKQIEKEIKKIKFMNQVIGPQVKVTDQDLRDYYQRNQERFRGSNQAHIAEVVMPLEGIASQGEMDKLGELSLSIVSRARHGTGFAELVKQYSKGPNAESGGDLGMVNLKDLPPQVADVVRNMKVGDISHPILTGNAVVIVKLISLPEISAGDFEKLRDEIYSALYDQKIEETLKGYLAKERQKAFIEIR